MQKSLGEWLEPRRPVLVNIRGEGPMTWGAEQKNRSDDDELRYFPFLRSRFGIVEVDVWWLMIFLVWAPVAQRAEWMTAHATARCEFLGFS